MAINIFTDKEDAQQDVYMAGPYKQQITTMELKLKFHQNVIEKCKNELTDDEKYFKGRSKGGKGYMRLRRP